MEAQPYDQLDDLTLLALCCWREARGEGMLGKKGVCHVVQNRVSYGGYGVGFHGVILRPYQFSSFNHNDPNDHKWPDDVEADWLDCLDAANAVMLAGEDEDYTKGSLFYFSPPLVAPPHAWGPVEIMLTVGHLTFCKPKSVESSDTLEEA